MVVGKGLLYNKLENICLDDLGRKVVCNSKEKYHTWVHYENGELINQGNHKCLDVENSSGIGRINTHYCEDKPDQLWYSFCESGDASGTSQKCFY